MLTPNTTFHESVAVNALHTVIGAGPLGRATALALTQRNIAVRLIHRRGSSVVPGVDVRAVDILDPDGLLRAIAGSSVVHFCAQPEYNRWLAEFEPMLDGVLRACERTGAALVSASNLYMYGDAHGPSGLSESTPEDSTSLKGRLRARMDARVLAAHRAGSVRAVVARGSDFFGPGVVGSVLGERVFADLRAGRTVRAVGDIDQPHTYTFVEDFGRALAELGTRPDRWGAVWHVPSAPPVTTRALLEQAGAIAGVKPKVTGMGTLGARMVGLFIAAVRETVELMPHFTAPYIVSDMRWRAQMSTRETKLEVALERTLGI